jgi:hypothetical protein
MLREVIRRKEIERTVYSGLDTVPLAYRNNIDCHLQIDVMRCEAM